VDQETVVELLVYELKHINSGRQIEEELTGRLLFQKVPCPFGCRRLVLLIEISLVSFLA
jgi:hypothetical protein